MKRKWLVLPTNLSAAAELNLNVPIRAETVILRKNASQNELAFFKSHLVERLNLVYSN